MGPEAEEGHRDGETQHQYVIEGTGNRVPVRAMGGPHRRHMGPGSPGNGADYCLGIFGPGKACERPLAHGSLPRPGGRQRCGKLETHGCPRNSRDEEALAERDLELREKPDSAQSP